MKPYCVLRGVVIDGRHRDAGEPVDLDDSTARFLMSIKAVEPVVEEAPKAAPVDPPAAAEPEPVPAKFAGKKEK